MSEKLLRSHGVAHDIKGLVRAALGTIETLSKNEDNEVRQQADQIAGALGQVVRVWMEHLDEMESSAPARAFDATGLAQLLRRVVAVNRADHDHADCQITYKVRADADVSLLVRELPLFQILNQLVAAATASVAQGGGSHVSIHAKRVGEQTFFDVRDDGTGLPEKVLALLIPKGCQDVASACRIGAGLATAARLAKELGGGIVVLKTSGKAAAFRLRLPNVPDVFSDTQPPNTKMILSKAAPCEVSQPPRSPV